jgi:transglutaminase-like putative cysteine protease
MNFYSVRHLTQFRYSTTVNESLMELRMHPRTEGTQRCLSFQLTIDPRAQVFTYRDYLGNSVHHFDVPGKHTLLRIIAESLVEVQPPTPLPPHLDATDWNRLDDMIAAGDYWELLMPSQFAQPTPGLTQLIHDLRVDRHDDPLSFLSALNFAIYNWFEYVPKATRVDSPIDHAIEARKGVCQDFAHIMIALVRPLRVPCRYVSGYMFHRDLKQEKQDRSVEGASHAWVEALVPRLGWVAFDPTNNLIGADRHIRVAIGRDYADVPPTRGVYKGEAHSELSVSVRVSPSDAPPPEPVAPSLVIQSRPMFAPRSTRTEHEQQQQQQ